MIFTIDQYQIEVLRPEIIELYAKTTMLDEYDDSIQPIGRGGQCYPDDLKAFVYRNWIKGPALEIGCGSGTGFDIFNITHAIEPCIRRYEEAERNARGKIIDVKFAFAEAIPFGDGMFSTVLSLRSVQYYRSQIEAFYEINRCLSKNGAFIFDIHRGQDYPYGGIVLDPWSILSVLKEMGFSLVEIRRLSDSIVGDKVIETTGIAVTKIRNVDLSYLRKLQIVRNEKNCTLLNFHTERDKWLL